MAKRPLGLAATVHKHKRSKMGGALSHPSASMKRMIRKIATAKGEVKELVTSSSYVASTTSGTVVPLNQIAEGDDYNNRVGRKICTKQIDVMYAYYSSGNAGGSAQVALVYDRQPDGAAPTYANIFDTSTAPNAGMAFKNTYNYPERFKIYRFDQLPESKGSADPTTWLDRTRFFIKPQEGDEIVRYSGTTAGVPNSGAWFLTYADTVNTTTAAKIMYNVKYQFTDS